VSVGREAREDAFAGFARAQFPELMRLARLLTGNEQLAEDLAQTALTKAFVHWRSVRRADNPTAYLMKIVINCWRSSRQWRLAQSEQPLDTGSDRGVLGGYAIVEMRRDLVTALADLPARQRLVLVLRYFVDLPESQVASLMGCSTSTVRSQASRALEKLRDHAALQTPTTGTGDEIS
jgi:RNA polymerase sigma-70 factor (sigma-E family)